MGKIEKNTMTGIIIMTKIEIAMVTMMGSLKATPRKSHQLRPAQ